MIRLFWTVDKAIIAFFKTLFVSELSYCQDDCASLNLAGTYCELMIGRVGELDGDFREEINDGLFKFIGRDGNRV